MVRSVFATALSSIAVMVGLSLPSAVQAETPALGWTAVMLDASEANIRTDGTLKYAYTASTTELTANGVTFSPWVSSSWDNNTSLENDNVILSGVFMRNTSANSEGVTGDYGAILNNAFWNNTLGDYTITFNNLTSGKRYLAQIVVHLHNGRPQLTVKDSDPSVWVKPFGFEAGQTWTYGGSLICVFDATGSSQSFTLNYSVDTPCSFNAIQVRELSGGDDPDPTVVDPEIGSIAATVNGMSVTIDLSGIVLGTDAQGASATSYKVDYEVRNSGGTAIKSGTVLSGQTAETASFDITNFTDPGTYTCEVTITTDKNRTASKSVEFTLTGEDPPTPGPTEGWTAEPMSASGDTIRKDGDFVYGYARKGGNGTYTVNGVTFTAFNDGGDFKQESKNPNVSISPNTFDWTTGLGSESISGDYGSMLDNAFWNATVSGNYTITLKNLEAGKSYLVQVVAHRSGQTYSVTSPDPAKAITVGGNGWTYGGSLVGVFAAETTEYSFTLNYGGSFVLNAIQVRKIAGVIPPTPATYAVTWTGGANAEVDVKANGSAINSGALVGDGTNVFFTVTPNTNYEFAEASYQDWTKSGEALTRTVTVYGAAVNITIPNATEKTAPPGPEVDYGWTGAKLPSDTSLVKTDGSLCYAYARDAYSINDISFVELTSNNNDDLSIGIVMDWKTSHSAPEGASGDYANMLKNGWWLNSGCSVTLKNLTSGNDYLVQIFCYRSSYNDGHVTIDGETLQGESYITSGGEGWSNGGTIIGIFHADSDTETFTIKSTSQWCFNAIQVRELSSVGPTPATYSVTWTGGANATVAAKANGSTIASGAKVGDGTNVFFTVTPNTNYEFAEASYQDWTLTEGVLTRTVTVNGAAVNVTIPNATAKSGPTPVEGDWYVSPDGDDSNNGKSADTPYATIAKAVSSAANGDVICVLAGNYTVTSVIDVSKAITIKGEGWDKTIVNGGSNRMFALKNAGAKLEGMKLTGSTANTRGAAVHMTDGTISRCFICGNSRTGSDFLGGAVSILKGTIDHSIFANNTSTKSGAAIGGSNPNGDILIDTCLVYGNGMASGSSGSGGIDFDNLNNVTCTIRNCTVVDNTSFGDFPAGVRVTGTGKAILINNVISGNIRDNSGTAELNLAVTKSLLDTTASRNCIITGTKDTDATYYRDAGAVSVISGSSAVVPTFVNAASGDYHLAEGSSAIAAGVTYTGIGVDLVGVAFAATPSAGCYEYSGVGPTPATYEVSWTGGANATVDAKANGVAINSGALVGDGTNVVFTVTPNTGYEFASASDGWTLSSGNLTKTFTVSGAALSVSVPNATKQADPPHKLGWTAAKMTADPASICKDGVLCYAYACGGDYIVNDVEFVKILNSDRVDGNQDKPIDNANLRWEVTNATQGQDAPGTTGDYTGLLKHCWWWWFDAPLTLRNLTPGHTYLVQVIGCRAGHDDTAQTSVAVVEAGDNSIFMKAAGDGWECGGTLVGTFEASDTTQTFHFEKITGSWSAFNAIQVRDLSLTDDDAVAIIERGSTTNYFFTIEDAYNGATAGETIKLVKDAEFPMNEPVFSKGVDLDLNGYVMTRSNLGHVKEITSDTVISNGTLAFATEAYSADLATPFLVDDAMLTLDTLKVGDFAGNEPLCLVTLTNGASAVLSGEGVYHAGSLFKSYDEGDTMTITGGRYVLRGWTFPGDETSDFADYDKGTLTISGGAFSIAPDKDWIALGYVILHDVTDRETPYHVVPAAEAPYTEPGWSYYYKDAAAAESAYVAKRETADGVKYYTSVQDAVEAANGVGTVTLVTDVPAIDREVVLTGTVTLDGNGHSVSVAHPYVDESGYVSKNYSFNVLHVVSVSKDADAVLRNISITGGGTVNGEQPFAKLDEKGLSAVANGGTLLMENVTVTRSNGAIVNLNGGKLFMDNCRIVRNCRFCAGGLFNMAGGFAVMNRTSLSENRSLGAGGGGGAAENGGTLFVNNCVVVNNSSTEVGGAINNNSTARDPKLYLMNTTIAGNFSSISGNAGQYDGMMGGGLGLQHGENGGKVIAVNSIITCNYQTRTDSLLDWNIKESDILSLHGDMGISLYYTVFTAMDVNPTGGGAVTKSNVLQLDVGNENVFNAYYASERIYQNAKPTAMAINSAQLIAKDDGSLDASLARYAPILRKLNDDKSAYIYGDAVYGTDGVYTYFDPSNWKNSEVKMAYATVKGTPDFFDYESAGELQQIGDIPLATAADMVTNYYESASGRSFGVAGASGWLTDEKIRYTVKLAGEPENGKVSGATLFGETYEEGTVITLTATPGYARDFLGWYEITDGGATTNFLSGSNKTVWELTVDHNYELLAKFSDLQEVLTPDPYVHVKMADDTDGPLLYPITMMTKWMREHYEDFEDTLAGKTKAEAEEWLTQILEQTSPGTGRKMWQDYVLGVDPNDANAKIWINSPQIRQEGQTAIRMEMNRLSPASGTKFTINYRLDKKLGDATTFARADVNGTGSYDVKVENDPTGLYVIDLLFIPEGKSTSEEYVTTVNTAGVLRVANGAKRAAISVPWTKLQPTGSSAVDAVDLVKTTNLSAGDVLYLYDVNVGKNGGYRAWEVNANGAWSSLNVFTVDDGGRVDWNRPANASGASSVDRGLGIWLERANTNDFIYVCGQYDAASVTTPISEGWNLVGAPGTGSFDFKSVSQLADGDLIVVPTAEEPLRMTYEDGNWGYLKNETTTYKGMKIVTPKRITDVVVPPGTAFWYISGATGNIQW